MNNSGPLWQMQEAVKSTKLLIKSHRDDITRAQERESQAMLDLEKYEKAVELLKDL